MGTLRLGVEKVRLPFKAPFRIAGFVFDGQDVVFATVDDGQHRGRGEAAGVYYLGDAADQVVAALEAHRKRIEDGIDRQALQSLLPAGGARNALDCALWELESRRAGKPVWQLAGLAPPKPLLTTFTLGAESPQHMAEGARNYTVARALKLKLTGEAALDIERVRAVRAARPDAWIGVDANQGYDISGLRGLIDVLVKERVSQLEQPLKRGREADLDGFSSPIPMIADESALTLTDVAGLVGRFSMVNIKLDKCGGLTEGLAMAREARRLGLGVMVGNMVGTSLAMAPSFIIGQLCDVVDLDGPTFLKHDPPPTITYSDGMIWCDEKVWGSPGRQPA
jgi:L-alanine-DL-glutamate epimerase-like enolase superfamily enzyme